MADRSNWFVSTEWLASQGPDANLVIVDGSWHLPTVGRDPRQEYLAAHIPGAVFFDIDDIADATTSLPHMLPTAEQFASAVGALGIDERQKIVVYDSIGLSSAPRVWWTFKIMGAHDVVILEGGLAKWQGEGRPVDSGEVARPARTFEACLDNASVRNIDQIRDGVSAGTIQFVDARSHDRFLGEAAEPRPGVRSGRIPGSFNLPFPEILDNDRLKDPESIRQAFDTAGIDLNRPIVTSCGSGVTAAILTLALETIGVSNSSLYDGSWAEWGSRDDTAIVKGPATETPRSA